jgi:hypothetical protein
MAMNKVWLALVPVVSHVIVSASSKSVMRQYNEDYLSFGFLSSGEKQPRHKGFVCGVNLAK